MMSLLDDLSYVAHIGPRTSLLSTVVRGMILGFADVKSVISVSI